MHGASSGCMDVVRKPVKKTIRRAIRKAIETKGAAAVGAVTTALFVINVAQVVAISVVSVAWVVGAIPDYTNGGRYEAVRGADGVYTVKEGAHTIPVRKDCIAS